MTKTRAAACRSSPSQVGKTPNHMPAQKGSDRPSTGVTGIQPTTCIVCTVWPTSTTSTPVISRPVAISIFLWGSLRSSDTTSAKTPTTPANPSSTPCSTVHAPASSVSAWRKSTVSKPSR